MTKELPETLELSTQRGTVRFTLIPNDTIYQMEGIARYPSKGYAYFDQMNGDQIRDGWRALHDWKLREGFIGKDE